MKKIYFLSILSIILSCQSIKKFNENLNKPISVAKLHKDIDFSYKKLKQLHPRLYWYISKEKLDFKFDSLKKSIKQPMTGLDFYKQLSQVTKNIGQGHLGISPSLPKYSSKEQKEINKKGKSPFNQFDLEFLNNKLFITKNKSKHAIKDMSEIVTINNENPLELINSYKRRVASDGYNTTFFNHYLGKYFGIFYTSDKGKIQDSLQLLLNYNNNYALFVVKRDTFGTKSNDDKIKLSKKERIEKSKFNSKYGYVNDTKTFTRQLQFLDKDSATAIMIIKGFSNGFANEFYEESFNKLQENNTKNLIIDIRNNPGGRLSEISNLYGYLVNEPYVFIDKYEVVSRTSKLHADFFKGGGVGIKIFKILIAPFYYSINYFKIQKIEGKYFYKSTFSNEKQPKPNNFKGKVYVLINGGSFSASSIISSNLKASNRAFFVGEETGGAFNGTVAAQLPWVQLPNSKVNLRIGLAVVSATNKTDIDGRGVFPDKEITPTFEDRKNNIDPELNWILEDIRREKEVIQLLASDKKDTEIENVNEAEKIVNKRKKDKVKRVKLKVKSIQNKVRRAK